MAVAEAVAVAVVVVVEAMDNYSNNRVHNDDTCPVHGGHKWRECFLNPHGDDYRPRTGSQSNNNSQGRGNGSRRGDAYHNDGNGGS